MLDQQQINDFFTEERYTREIKHLFNSRLPRSGYALLDNIGPEEKILDVGCGYNLFKDLRPDLVGIDPVHDEADFKVAIQDFETAERFDVALCLGSVQFGTIDDVRQIITKIVSLLKPQARIYWRTTLKSNLPDFFFRFRTAEHEMLSAEFGFELVEVLDEAYVEPETQKTVERLYAEWRRV